MEVIITKNLHVKWKAVGLDSTWLFLLTLQFITTYIMLMTKFHSFQNLPHYFLDIVLFSSTRELVEVIQSCVIDKLKH